MSRRVNVFLLPELSEPAEIEGGIAVVIDVLRATTTMVTALAQGAVRVIASADIASARQAAASLPAGSVLLGGERKGVAIDGFDLDNSPRAYTRDRVVGKTIVLTTTNGTIALIRSSTADRILIGSLVNRRATVRELVREERSVHLICAGTDGRMTSEDLLGAGAIVCELEAQVGPVSSRDDLAQVAAQLWRSVSASSDCLNAALRQSRGGRNLVELGFDADIDAAAQVDSIDLCAEYFPATGFVEAVTGQGVSIPYRR